MQPVELLLPQGQQPLSTGETTSILLQVKHSFSFLALVAVAAAVVALPLHLLGPAGLVELAALRLLSRYSEMSC
mgnify:CR=1 FL=1